MVLELQKQALPKLNPNLSSCATKSSNGNHSGPPDSVKSVLELLSYSENEENVNNQCKCAVL